MQRGTFVNPFFVHPSNLLKLIGRFRFRHLSNMSKTMGDAKRALSYEPVSPTSISRGSPCLILKPENNTIESQTIDPVELGAWPTQAFLELMFKSHGFSLERLKWDKKAIKNWTFIQDYKDSSRASYLARPLV